MKSKLMNSAWLTDRKINERHCGMVLSEILLAGAIISIALASCVIVLGSLQSMVISSEKNFSAELLARQEIADLQMVSFEYLKPFTKIKNTTFGDFTADLSVAYRNPFVADISVAVSWYDGEFKKQRTLSQQVVDWQDADNVSDCGWLNDVTLNGLKQIDISAINADMSDLITDISVQGDIAYVSANGTSTSLPDLYVLNVHDPQKPEIIASLNTGPGISSIVANGGYVFAANAGSYQLQVIDVSDPLHPVLVSQAKLPGVTISGGAGFGKSIAYFGHHVYVGLVKASGPEFHVVDVHEPTAPIALGAFEVGSTVNDISVSQNFATIGTPGIKSVMVLDVSLSQNIKEAGETTFIGWQTQGVSSVYILGSQIYTGRSLGGFYSPNPDLVYLRRDDLSTKVSELKIGASIDDVFVYGSYMYLATNDLVKTFQMVNVSNNTVIMSSALASRTVSISCNSRAMYVVTENDQNFFHAFLSNN